MFFFPPFPPRSAFNTVLFSHTACLAFPPSICSQGFLPSFSLSPLKPEAVCFKSVTSSLALSLDLSIGILNSTTRYMRLSLGNDTLYPLDPQLPSHSRRHQTAAARFYGVCLLLRETHPWHFWRSRWADFLFTAAAKRYSLVTLMLLLIAQQIKQPFLACYQSPCTKSSAPSSLRRMKNLHTTILQAQAIQGHLHPIFHVCIRDSWYISASQEISGSYTHVQLDDKAKFLPCPADPYSVVSHGLCAPLLQISPFSLLGSARNFQKRECIHTYRESKPLTFSEYTNNHD